MYDAIKFSGYKSFPKESANEIIDIQYLNIFIGKNNCGKSSVLDIIGCSFDGENFRGLPHRPECVSIGYTIDEDLLKRSYSDCYGWYNTYKTHKYLGEYIWSDIGLSQSFNSKNIITFEVSKSFNHHISKDDLNLTTLHSNLPRYNKSFVRIAAERNISPEIARSDKSLYPSGSGATNLVRTIINDRNFDENIIENDLLAALNQIMGDDAQFKSIRIQEYKKSKDDEKTYWEIYLQEENFSRIPLSQSGSGLKTIILVLLNLLVLPKINPKTQYVYGFEELENNLHPALQRRLFEYVYDFAVKNQIYIFLTTHSHVAINMFFDKKHASLYHVIKENQVSTIKKIDNYMDKVEILDDLDVKASDLLQANGIIWVEGPSDRVYIKKWLQVFGGTDIEEGKDFQFAYYGGRLLSHYSVKENVDGLINILLVNRNSAIVMDSDKRAQSTKINETKSRVKDEFSQKGLFCWITKGKEIENYIAVSAINRALNIDLDSQCQKYQHFPEYIADSYKRFGEKKVVFANLVQNYIEAENVLDLESQIVNLYKTIKSWNA